MKWNVTRKFKMMMSIVLLFLEMMLDFFLWVQGLVLFGLVMLCLFFLGD